MEVYYSHEKRADDGELFKLIYRAATHAFAHYGSSMLRLRLTILFGGGNMICLASNKSDLYRNYNDAEDRRDTERIMGLRRIVHPKEDSNVINYYDEFLCIQAVVNSDPSIHWYEPCPELRKAFMDEFEKILTTTDNFCLFN
ncbi:hypothetical protein IKX12_03360 [Candidatus Saccharibacteria bacterium]|nr:hypothetical protein [Candidatus Saccharibacteria bacterium]